MNKGFSYYFRSGIFASKSALKGQSFAKRCLLILYLFLSFLGKIFLFTRPIFQIADMNLCKMVDECHEFSFEKVFENVDDGKRYSRLLLFTFIKELMMISGFIFIVAPSLLLWPLLQYANLDQVTYYVICGIFTGAFALIGLIYILIVHINYLPASYIASVNRNLGIADYLYNSKKGMYGLRRTVVGLAVVYSLIFLAIYGVLIAGMVCLCIYLEFIGQMITFFLALIMIFLTIFFIEKLFLSNKVSYYSIYKYGVSDEKTIVVRRRKRADSEEEDLETILDDSEDVEYEEEVDE